MDHGATPYELEFFYKFVLNSFNQHLDFLTDRHKITEKQDRKALDRAVYWKITL
jgi:hypothetical protein